MITPQDAKNLIELLNRVDVKGSEVIIVAQILVKLNNIASPKPEKDEKPKKGDKK